MENDPESTLKSEVTSMNTHSLYVAVLASGCCHIFSQQISVVLHMKGTRPQFGLQFLTPNPSS